MFSSYNGIDRWRRALSLSQIRYPQSVAITMPYPQGPFIVDAVYLGAKDILRVVEDEFTSADDTTNIRAERFVEKLSQQLQVPKRLLN